MNLRSDNKRFGIYPPSEFTTPGYRAFRAEQMNIAASNDVRDVASTKTPERNGNQKLRDYELSIERNSVFDLLKQLAIDNEVYFKQCYPSVYTTRIAECCQEIYISLDLIRDTVEKFLEAAKSRDYDANTPGNGFRSLVCIIDVVTLRLVSVISMLSMLDDDSLFPPLNSDYEQFNGILKGIESLDASCFYGRHLGFQFSQSVKRIFNVIGMVLAGYSMSWTIGCGSVGILMNSAKLLLNPEERASRIMKVIREADIEFCRGFWNLSELPDAKLFCPSLAVCEKSEIPLVGAIAIDSNGQDFIYISPPKAHGIPEPIPIKILDVVMRKAEQKPNLPIKAQLSPNLVIHCHGGGYVATSSKSHETYLRGWAKSLECPLISIDYSLAPESPFPRAMEEVLYAYAYILNHPTDFGWSGEKVCMVGDSAGGNLIISMNLRLIELGAKRLPDGIVPIYTPFLFQKYPACAQRRCYTSNDSSRLAMEGKIVRFEIGPPTTELWALRAFVEIWRS
ncbi:alpha/beta hydrolase fold domain-containing protein [Ditylenchus destructor]|uniref:Alpha/beta hydrolase fold domain-containing protein n=1 Tax=Ditylenchus destructor TaxID=166010 RepID=A0AAD4QW76_9BILA|nr:alpha/beta hydrolase fold domain-containing protein [Ditylenchus destructor]